VEMTEIFNNITTGQHTQPIYTAYIYWTTYTAKALKYIIYLNNTIKLNFTPRQQQTATIMNSSLPIPL
jgi:hypothetical protein